MGFDVLILTDHSTHTDENSVYAIASALAAHKEINSVDIASRGSDENLLFFNGEIDAPLSVIPAIPDLNFNKACELFDNATTEVEAGDYDFILLRLPPPIPEQFFNALADHLPEDHIINSPSGIIRTSSKAFLLQVSGLCPPVAVIENRKQLLDFTASSPVVLKPLSGYGGAGIVKVMDGIAETGEGQTLALDQFLQVWDPPYLGMEFLPRVNEGDKRTIVVNGEVVGSALRLPAQGQWVCNVARGGRAEHAVAASEEIEIAKKLTSVLEPLGIVIFGFDTLVGHDGLRVLSEINTMSIGGIKQIRDSEGRPALPKVIVRLVSRMEKVWFGDNT